MATRTVRLDAEAERVLAEVRAATGLPISEALKRGLRSLRERIGGEAGQTAYDVYKTIALGPGGRAIAASTDVRRGVRQALRKKHGR